MTKPQTIAIDDVYDDLFVQWCIDPRDDTLHERTWLEAEIYQFRFANRKDKTNCLIKIDTDLM
jgi:hypothetical protein